MRAKQRELQEREAEIDRYRNESERQRAEILTAAKSEARDLLSKAHADATRELRDAETSGNRLLEQSRHQATELTNSARAEVEQTLEWARAQAGAVMARAQKGAEQFLTAAGLGEPAVSKVVESILAANEREAASGRARPCRPGRPSRRRRPSLNRRRPRARPRRRPFRPRQPRRGLSRTSVSTPPVSSPPVSAPPEPPTDSASTALDDLEPDSDDEPGEEPQPVRSARVRPVGPVRARSTVAALRARGGLPRRRRDHRRSARSQHGRDRRRDGGRLPRCRRRRVDGCALDATSGGARRARG